MELGQKLKQARVEQGLSQRQVCGDVITRNMLSLIENGSASPSMDTLRYLAGKLGKTVSYFLEEDAVLSPNQSVMEGARTAFEQGHYDQTLQALQQYREPDPVFDYEEALLQALAMLNLAKEAISRGKCPYALELLEKVAAFGGRTPYYTMDLERRRLLLRAQVAPTELLSEDLELLLRAETALNQNQPEKAARYLEAAQVQSGPHWNYLRGQVYMKSGSYAEARPYLEGAWDHNPKSCAAMLEQCCRELEDYKGAYHYACMLRDGI